MIEHIVRLPLDYTHGLTIFVFGDMQYGSTGFREEAWQDFEAHFRKTKNTYAIGLGDYLDFTRPTMRKMLDSLCTKDDGFRAQVDSMAQRLINDVMDKMAFLKGHCIEIHEGHHTYKFSDGTTADQRIAAHLKAPFAGWLSTVRLALEKPRTTSIGTDFACTIVSAHGEGSARTVPGDFRRQEQDMGFILADVTCRGHGCKSGTWSPGQFTEVRRRGPAGHRTHTQRFVSVGGFSGGYTDGWNADYVERAGYRPMPCRWGVIELKIDRCNLAQDAAGLPRRKNAPRRLAIKTYTDGPDRYVTQD